jgi:menaquinone-dependent protoporphyrinogen oxidase
MTKILVAYASKHNSTAEIADAIGEVFQHIDGLNVDVRSVELVEDLSTYDAVILGSAVYAGQWQPSAADFLRKHEAELAKRPTWLFSSGPTGEGDPKELMKGWEFPQALQAAADRIHPREIVVFHGNMDEEHLSFFERSIVKLVRAPMGDFRDWKMIREWATGVAETLRAGEPEKTLITSQPIRGSRQ